MADIDAAPVPSSLGVSLGSTEIIPTMPLPDLAAAGGPAFAARYRGDGGSALFAVLCQAGLPVRTDTLNAMRTIDHPSVMRVMESGVVDWPADRSRYFALAYHRPLLPRFKQNVDEPHTPISEDAVNHYFVTPLIGALAEFMRTGAVHGGIRTTNMYWRSGNAAPPQLGECLSAPPGIGQPVLFETLERGMSMPLGRGSGTHSDDCYAFGVALALVVLGQNPLRGLDERAVLQAKLEKGSFAALIGNNRLSSTHSELLRGLLTDDGRQRWTAAELEQWLTGRRLTPKNTEAGRRASRHLEFAGKEYWLPRQLAEAMAQQVSDAVRLVQGGVLDKWLRRALGDEQRADNLQEAEASLKDSGKMAHSEDQLVARACIALDPSAPIRYRGLTVMPTGLASMLAEAVQTGTHLQALSEIISSQLVTFWVNMQKDQKIDLIPLGQQYERMRTMIERTAFGSGVERVLYELNPGLPCLSPMLRGQYVASPKALLSALERSALAPDRPRDPMDRHIAAFLIARERRSDALFEAMAGSDTSVRKGTALLTLFGDLQQRYGPDQLPQIAQWMLPYLDAAGQRFLSKSLREKMQKQIRDTAGRGDLNAMQRLLDDPQLVERDRQEFLAARLLYLNVLKEIGHLESGLANRDSIVDREGKPAAASVSGFLAIFLVLVAILRAVWQSL